MAGDRLFAAALRLLSCLQLLAELLELRLRLLVALLLHSERCLRSNEILRHCFLLLHVLSGRLLGGAQCLGSGVQLLTELLRLRLRIFAALLFRCECCLSTIETIGETTRRRLVARQRSFSDALSFRRNLKLALKVRQLPRYSLRSLLSKVLRLLACSKGVCGLLLYSE